MLQSNRGRSKTLNLVLATLEKTQNVLKCSILEHFLNWKSITRTSYRLIYPSNVSTKFSCSSTFTDPMRANEDSGLETTLERRSVRKGPLIQRFVRSVRERFTPLRSGGGSTSILRNNENLGVELDSDSPHQSDIDLLDSNEIKELRNDDQWNEVLNMQVSSQDETVVEPLIGEETRELLSYFNAGLFTQSSVDSPLRESSVRSFIRPATGLLVPRVLQYNQLLEQARAITDLEKTTDRVENTEDISIDFQNLELINEENQDRAWFYQQYGNTRITEIPVDDLIFELQYLLRKLTNKEVGTALRALLLTKPTILTPIELFKHCGLKTYYESTDSGYESVHSGEQQSRSESELVPQSLVILETEEESSKNSVPIKIVRAEIHTQGDQIPLDCPKSIPSTTTITCPAVTHSQSSMNTQIPQSQLASTPCNYLPYQGLQSRKGHGDSCYRRHWLPGGSTLATPTLATRHWLPIRPTLATPTLATRHRLPIEGDTGYL
ncbi:hypothetical protein OUZ56_011451 [Daphnia magna]|uniref:Uncharacterized protein n=1 Tax=Daphnia magna TaxID=35525 RepID=A0ABQ9Z080_9CRUS|nr:hypothetical protein OUZ56_011451 [Daphnia magna]